MTTNKKPPRFIKFLKTNLFSFSRLSLLDRLIIITFTLKGYRPTSSVVNDQWKKGTLFLVHDSQRWTIFDGKKAWPLL